MNKVVHFLLTLLIMFAVSIAPAQALLKGGTWQELNSTTGAVNGTAPLADGATIPLYQGSMLLDPTKTYDIEFTAMPRDFSADASSCNAANNFGLIHNQFRIAILAILDPELSAFFAKH